MTITPTALFGPAAVPASVAALYTCPTNSIAFIQAAVFSNTDSGSHTVTAYVIRSGGSPGTGNQVISVESITATSTYKSPELAGVVLGPGDSIQAFCDTGALVNLMLNGFLMGSSGS